MVTWNQPDGVGWFNLTIEYSRKIAAGSQILEITRWRFLPAKGVLILIRGQKVRRKSDDQRMPLKPVHGLPFPSVET
jgi:hypothetical protein